MTQVVGFYAKNRRLGSSYSQIDIFPVGFCIFWLHKQGNSLLRSKNTSLKLELEPHTKQLKDHFQCCGNRRTRTNSKTPDIGVYHTSTFVSKQNNPNDDPRTAYATWRGNYISLRSTSFVAVPAEHAKDVDNALKVSAIPQRFFQNKNHAKTELRNAFGSRPGENPSARTTSGAAVTAERNK